jgi:hypothetical protein
MSENFTKCIQNWICFRNRPQYIEMHKIVTPFYKHCHHSLCSLYIEFVFFLIFILISTCVQNGSKLSVHRLTRCGKNIFFLNTRPVNLVHWLLVSTIGKVIAKSKGGEILTNLLTNRNKQTGGAGKFLCTSAM